MIPWVIQPCHLPVEEHRRAATACIVLGASGVSLPKNSKGGVHAWLWDFYFVTHVFWEQHHSLIWEILWFKLIFKKLYFHFTYKLVGLIRFLHMPLVLVNTSSSPTHLPILFLLKPLDPNILPWAQFTYVLCPIIFLCGLKEHRCQIISALCLSLFSSLLDPFCLGPQVNPLLSTFISHILYYSCLYTYLPNNCPFLASSFHTC